MPWDFALILLLLGVLVPWRGSIKMRQLLARPSIGPPDRLALYASTIAFQWLSVVIIVWRVRAHGIALEEFGIAMPDAVLVAGMAAGLSCLLILYQLAGLRRFARLDSPRSSFLYQMATKILPQSLVESLAFAALTATVALCEEFIYRGFALAVIAHALRGSLFVGAIVSSLFFAVAHAYQGRRGIILTLIVGGVFAGVRIWTGSLIPSIVAHFLTDLIAGFAAPRILRQLPEAQPPAIAAR